MRNDLSQHEEVREHWTFLSTSVAFRRHMSFLFSPLKKSNLKNSHLKSQAVVTTKSRTCAGVPPCFTEGNKKIVLNDAACFSYQYSQTAKEPDSCS